MPNLSNVNSNSICWRIQSHINDTSHPTLPDYERILRRLQFGFNQSKPRLFSFLFLLQFEMAELIWLGRIYHLSWVLGYQTRYLWCLCVLNFLKMVFINKIICYWLDFRLLKFLSSCLDLLYTCLHVFSLQSQPLSFLWLNLLSLKIPMCYSFILWHNQLCCCC